MSITERLNSGVRSIDIRTLAGAIGVGLLPAFGAYFMASIAASGPLIWLFWVAWIVFAGAFYRKDNLKNQIGAGLFWLAIEAFLFPIAILVFTFVFVTGQSNAFAAAGGAIGGGIIFVVSWFIAWLVGVVLYLLSRRFEPSA